MFAPGYNSIVPESATLSVQFRDVDDIKLARGRQVVADLTIYLFICLFVYLFARGRQVVANLIAINP
eukprot:SAG31_NODE_6383_length_2037_cov_27.616615_1_plen_66_part_10